MKTPNLTKYVCDRCGTTAIIAEGDNTRDWHEITRLDADDKPVSKLLDTKCWTLYQALAQKHSIEFQQFMTQTDKETA